VEEAGFQPNIYEIGREKLIDDLRELAQEIERTPRKHDVEEKAPHSPSAYRSEFGSWNDALRVAGFNPNLEMKIPKPNLVAEINRLAEGDEPPTTREMRERGKYSISAYRRAFDRWNEAVREAGYEPRQETDGEGVDPNGYDYDRYGKDWTKKSYQIRDKYDECPLCGRSWSTLDAVNVDFEVHHVRELDVDLDETPIEYEEEPTGYIPLCRECHMEWEGFGIGPDFRPGGSGEGDEE